MVARAEWSSAVQGTLLLLPLLLLLLGEDGNTLGGA